MKKNELKKSIKSELLTEIMIARRTQGLKKKRLAKKVGLSKKDISNMQKGLYYPSFKKLEACMKVLQIELNGLYTNKRIYH